MKVLNQVFEDALRQNPSRASRKDAYAYFVTEIRRDLNTYLEPLMRFWFDRTYPTKYLSQDGDSTVIKRRPLSRRETIKRKRREKREFSKAYDRLANVVFLDLIMPNGKKFRECTVGEVEKFGGIFTRLAGEAMKEGAKRTNLIDKYINEADAKAVCESFLKTDATVRNRSAGRHESHAHA